MNILKYILITAVVLVSSVSPLRAAVPAPPGNVKAFPHGANEIRVTWEASAGATGYKVYRSSVFGGTGFALKTTVSTLVWDDTTVTTDTKYWYKVIATNSSGSSANSNWDSSTAGLWQKIFPRGVVYCDFSATTATNINGNLNTFLSTNTWVKGFAIICRWADLEPTTQGTYDWSALEAAQAVAHARNIPMLIVFKTGGGTGYTPAWVSGSGTGQLKRPIVTTGNGDKNLVPWDSIVRGAWLATLANIASHSTASYGSFGADSLIAGIYVAGCNAQYPEMIMPNDTNWSSVAFCSPTGTSPANLAYDPSGTPNGSVYSTAWENAIVGYANAASGAWNTTWFINMLDEMNNVSTTTTDKTAPRIEVTSFVEGTTNDYFTQCTLGTANIGYWNDANHTAGNELDLTRAKFVALRDSACRSPIYYEIGPNKMDGTAGHLDKALSDARNVLGCKAVILFNTVLSMNSTAFLAEAQNANSAYWGIQ